VTLIETRPEARERCLATVRDTLAASVKRGRATREEADARLSRFTLDGDMAGVADADIVVEAVFEEMGVKRDVFAALDRLAKPGAILASNTSTLDIDAIAAVTSRPEAVAGTHFFSPANVMKLLEIVRGAATAPEVTGRLLALAKRLGKVGVVAGVCDGFIGNRMFEEYLRQAYWMLEEGALPDQVDTAMERWGMALGPLRVMDLAGNDIGWSVRKRRAVEHPDAPYSRIPDAVCERGRFGQKTGAGWYLYPDGRRAVPDPAIDALVIAESERLHLARRTVPDEEVVERGLLALINEGAKLLADGIAARPLDVDQVWLHGYGFPAERGGPMFHADRLGLPHVLARVEALHAGRNGWAWTPAPLLRDLVARGEIFASLNKA
jgi:3-hydroxyacyl-CoA dehydrogenase